MPTSLTFERTAALVHDDDGVHLRIGAFHGPPCQREVDAVAAAPSLLRAALRDPDADDDPAAPDDAVASAPVAVVASPGQPAYLFASDHSAGPYPSVDDAVDDLAAFLAAALDVTDGDDGDPA